MTSPPKTSVDWLRVRVQAEPREALEALRGMYGTLGSSLHVERLPRGILGFQQALSVNISGMPIGRMDFGGESQRGWVRLDLPAKGCEWVQDWSELGNVEALPKAEIRRCDIALTTWDGEVGHATVVKAHRQGRFITRGRPPEMSMITSTDARAGKTCYVGTREKSEKFFRAYEKGFEMASKLPCGVTHIDGKRIEDIYRCELELKAISAPIPFEVIERRDHYFAGAYPFCADVLPDVEGDILMRRPDRAPQTDLAVVLGHVRTQYGAALYTALRAYDGDIGAVWNKIVGDHHSQPLVEAGVLLVEHE